MGAAEDFLDRPSSAEEFLGPEKPTATGEFSKGFKRSFAEVPGLISGLAAYGADAVGATGARDKLLDYTEHRKETVEKDLGSDAASFTNVLDGKAGAGDFLANAGGYVSGQALQSIVTGGGGALIAKMAAKKAAAKAGETVLQRELAAGATRAVAEKAAAAEVAKVGTRAAWTGATVAGFGQNLAMEGGSIYPEAVEQAKTEGRELTGEDLARVGGATVAAAATDTAMDRIMAGKVLAGSEGTTIIRRLAKEVPKGMAREAGTEGIQTGIERYGAGQELMTPEAIRDYVDSMAVGAVGGGLGGAAAGLTERQAPAQPVPTPSAGATPGAGATPPASGPVPPAGPATIPANPATVPAAAQPPAGSLPAVAPPTAAEIAEGLKMGGGAIPINQDVDGVPVMTGLRFNGKTYEPDDAGIQAMYQAAGNLARAKAQGLTPFTDTIEGRALSDMEEQAQADLADMRKFGGSNVKKTTERIPAVIRSIKEAAAAPDAGPLAIAAAAGVDSGAVQQAAIEQATAADTEQMTQVEATQQEAAKTAETAQKEADKAAATAKKEADQKAATEEKARRTAEADKAKAEDRTAKASADGEKVAKLHARFVGLQSKMRPEEVDGTKKVLDKLLSGKVSQAEHDQYEKMAGTMERMLDGRAKKEAAKTASEKPSQPTPAPTETQSGGEKSFSAPAGDEKRSPADQQFIESLPPESKEHADLAIKAHAKNPDLTTAALEHPEMGPKAERTIFEAIIHGRTNDRDTRALIARFGLPESAAKRGNPESPENQDQRGSAETGTKGPGATGAADDRGAGVDAGAHEAAVSPQNDKPEPTKEQILGGNAELGHVKIAGLDISIENPEGSTRTDLQNDPPQWRRVMTAHYGYIKGTIGKDKDHLDVFIKPGTPEDFTGQVFVIDQKNADGGFDEHKIMLGYAGLPEALKAYKAHYPKDWDGVMGSTGMTMAEFKDWIKGDTTKPVTKADAPLQSAMESEGWAAEDAGPDNTHWSKRVGNERYTAILWQTKDKKQAHMEVTALAEGGVDTQIASFDVTDAGAAAKAASKAVSDDVEGQQDELPPEMRAYEAKAEAAEKAQTKLPEPQWWKDRTGAERVFALNAAGIKGTALTPWNRLSADNQRALNEQWGPKEAPPAPPKQQSDRKEIGKNRDGATLYEDWRGVRTLVQPGETAGTTETVQMRPTRSGMQIVVMNSSNRPDEYKTVEELAEEAPSGRRAEFKLSTNERARVLESAERGEFVVKVGDSVYGSFKLDGNNQPTEFKSRAQWADPLVREAAGQFVASQKPAAEAPSGMTLQQARDTLAVLEKQVAAQGRVADSRLDERVRNFQKLVADMEAEAAPKAPAKSPEQLRAEADLMAGLADLADIFGKNAKLNMLPEQQQKIGPVLTRVFDAAFRLGYIKFKQAAKFVLDTIRTRIGPEIADQITIDDLQGAYIGMAQNYKDKGADPGKVVVAVESLAELETGAEQAQNGPSNGPSQTPAPGGASNRPLESAPSKDVRTPEGSGNTGTDGAGSGTAVDGRKNQPDAAGDSGRLGLGNGAGAVPPVAGGAGSKPGSTAVGGPAANAGNQSPDVQPGQRRAVAKTDYRITEKTRLGEGGQKTKYANNLAAIQLVKRLQAEDRGATPDEQHVLARYVGWDGIPQAFDKDNAKWAAEYKALKDLLTPEEWQDAFDSTQFAHYTAENVIGAIYQALGRLGFKGNGRFLEAGSGVGNFVGLAPKEMLSGSRFTGIERDAISGAIAQYLYPNQSMQVADFTRWHASDGTFDVAIGNPPFSRNELTDASGRKHLSRLRVHNYFFAKSIDLLRDGGIFAEVVSNGFMDSREDRARKYIGERTRLLGAIRLPNNAFKGNANTEVTTDIVFLQKLPQSEWGSKEAKADAKRWMDLVNVPDPLGGADIPVNRYFAENPTMMLGRMERAGSMYGPDQPALIARNGEDITKELARAIKNLPEGIYQSAAVSNTAAMEKAQLIAMSGLNTAEGGYFVQDGKLYQRAPDIAGEQFATLFTPETQWTEKTTLGDARHARLVQMAEMAFLTRQLIAAEISNAEPDMLTTMRADLNQRYDAYVGKHGPLNARPNLQLYDEDPELPLLLSLERDYDPGIAVTAAKKQGIKPIPPSAKKADILSKRVNYEREAPDKADSPADAVMISIAERGRIDADYIAQLLGQDADGILQELAKGDKPALFLDPASNGYVLADEYLSGNVRKKLLQAKAAHQFDNVRALEAVIPADIPGHQIYGKVGANWVPTDVYEDFARELFGDTTQAGIRYVKVNSSYIVDIEGASEIQAYRTYGVRGKFAMDEKGNESGPELNFSGPRILAQLLNNKEIKVGFYDDDHKFHLSKRLTDEANDKAAAIRERFSDWLMSDPDRSERLTREYNDVMNNYVARRYDGSMLRFPGKVPDEVIKFRKHQRNAISRIMQDRQALLDHVVGAGKTFTVVSAAMEMRRTGLARKPVITVPNHLVKQWASDFYRLYPGAKILAATKKDFEKLNRRRFLAKIATGDWDAVILAHSSFGFIKPPAEFEERFAAKQIDVIIKEIEAMGGEGDGKRGKKTSDDRDSATKRTVKQLAAMRDRLKERVKRLRDKPMDDLLDFEQLGADMLFVDEAHLFKNLMFATKMNNVRGMGSPEGSQRAYDMYIKTQYIMEKYGKGVVFATGTPVSNSLAEMYHMLRYLAPQTLEDMHHETFDAWVNTFASVESVWMQALSGEGFKSTNRLDKFVNAPELLKVFGQVADTVTMDDIKAAYREENAGKEFPLPPLKGDRRTPVSLPITKTQQEFMEDIAKRAKALEKRRGPPKKGEDNMLSIMGDARRGAIDIRMVNTDIVERDPDGRLAKVAANVLERYKQYNDVKGTQLIFSDLGTPLKHAKKELAEYEELQARAAPLQDESIRARADLGDEEAVKQIEDAEAAVATMEANGKDWLDGIKIAMRGFSVYDDLRKALMEGGIPDGEIAFIHDYNTDEQKAALFRAVNQGKVRVLLGSTAKLGAGTNVQEKLVALHHVDVPWKPSDIEQREGRIVRQGNLLPDLLGPDFAVEIQAYVTQDTLDLFMWQLQEAKLNVIGQIRTGKVEREIDNAFEEMQMSAGEMQAAATSDPLLMQEIRLKDKIKKLERQKKSFEGGRNDLINRLKRAEQDAARLPSQIEQATALKQANDLYQAGIEAWKAEQQATINGVDIIGADAIRKTVLDAIHAIETPVFEKYGYPYNMKTKVEKSALSELVRAAWKESGVTFNGKTYHSDASVADAVRDLLGDVDTIAFTTPKGEVLHRRSQIDRAIESRVVEALTTDGTATVGKFGDIEMVVEGYHKGDEIFGEVTLKFDGREESIGASKFAASAKLDEAAPPILIRSANNALYYASNSVADLERRKQDADRAIEDAKKHQIEEVWPKEAELTAARQEYLTLLNDLRHGKSGIASALDALYGPGHGIDALMNPIASRAKRGAGRGVSVPELTRLAAAMGGNIKIAATQADLPESASRFRSEISTGVRGVFIPKTGEIYLVAENLQNLAEGAFVAMHEGAHRGLRKLFGDELKPVLNRIWMGNKNVRTKTAEYMAQYNIDKMEAIEEVLADMAMEGTAKDLTGWEMLVEFIRTWVQKFGDMIGAKLPITDDMVETIVAAASRKGLETEAREIDPFGLKEFGVSSVDDISPAYRTPENWRKVPAQMRDMDATRGLRHQLAALEKRLNEEAGNTLGSEAVSLSLDGNGNINVARLHPSESLGGDEVEKIIAFADASDLGIVVRRSAGRSVDFALHGLRPFGASIHQAATDFKNPLLKNHNPVDWVREVRGAPLFSRLSDQLKGMNKGGGGDLFKGAVELDGGTKTMGWRQFGDYLAKRKMRDGFGVLTEAEKRNIAAAGGVWTLTPINATTLKPVESAPVKGDPIIVGQDGDVIDGRHRRDEAIRTNTPIWAWVASDDDQPLASRGPGSTVEHALDALRSVHTPRQALNTVGEILQSTERFNVWNRTVGTQFQKAHQDADFGRVFDAVNAQITDTSRYSIEAEQLAPNILQRLETVKDVGKALFQGRKKHREDMKAVAQAVFDGIEGQQGVQSQVFTDAELRNQFSLTDRQIDLYREFRRSVDTSLDRLTQSTAMKIAESYLPVRRYAGLPLAFTMRSLEQRMQNLMQTIPPGDDRAAVAEALNRILDLEQMNEGLKDKGYAPAMRFGRYAVSVGSDPQALEVFSMYETQTEANLAAMALRKQFPNEPVTQSVLNDEAWKEFAGVSPETVELFARFTGASQSAAYKQYIELARSSRSAMKRMLDRKGISGFSIDASRVLAQFVTSNARQASMNVHGGEITESLASPTLHRKGDVHKEAQHLAEYIRNPTEEAQSLRGLLFMHFMGGSLASAAVNMTQPVLMTTPYLSQFIGAKDLAGIMGRAAKAATSGKVSDPGMRNALARAAADGVTQPHEIHQLMAEAQGSAFGTGIRGRAFAKAWGGFFSLSEAWNRKLTFMAAFEVAQKTGHASPYRFAVNAVEETQGIYNKANRPNWARGPIGATLFTFKQFSIAYLEFLSRLPRKQMVIALAMLMVAAGLEGMPFADDIEDLIDTIGQRLGYATNSKKWLRKKIGSVLGDGMTEFVLHGFSAMPGFPIDVAGRMGMSNLIPGTALFNPSRLDKSREILEVFGAAGGFAKGLMDAADSGRISDALPVAVKNAVQAYKMWSTGEYRDTKGRLVRKVDGIDAAAKSIGFQPAALAADSRRIGESMRDIDIVKRVESEITSKWAQGIIEKDPAKVEEAKKQLIDWNQANADMPIRVGSPQIARRVREAMVTRDVRFIKTAPPEMRANIMREMHQ